ncbi:hypothetical protein [Streptomyces corynorhini]|uniref:Uncharacterized protein n=1 Tax=Streptomyces corynorhini TaxID=2282652 RepID=A0A370BE50_9ACTN|nr:hypothetical protein [Streptomyces corynorhini]RDG38669.1 hypothetical protein DVH02_08000 [Streptomyces corynorhini]
MHHHGYLWTGPKNRFDEERLRRPPHPDPPQAATPGDVQAGRLQDRYREAAAEFPVIGLPPLETAQWLMKPKVVVRGTWQEPKEAADWLGRHLARHAPRFDSAAQRGTTHLALLVNSATERLSWGGDVSLGFYLERPVFLSLALVTCSPNRSAPGLSCPAR